MKKKVLIIEDDPKDYELLKKWTISMGFTTVLPKDHSKMTKAMRNNVTEDFVFKQIRENYKNLVLILCDLRHHGNYQAGNNLVEKIRNELVVPQMVEWSHKVPIFCVTRYTALLSDSYSKGASGLIDKTKLEEYLNGFGLEKDKNNSGNTVVNSTYETECRNKINDHVCRFEKDLNDNAIKVNGQKVFIVHGHNTKIKIEVYNTLLRLKLKPIVLHEQANKGRAIMEKFEANSADVGFAIILLTADDVGREKDEVDFKPRARQNVVFEMGYFMAKFSRSRVFLLLEKGVERPSDLEGIVYTSLEDDWKSDLIKELRACGYKANANDLI